MTVVLIGGASGSPGAPATGPLPASRIEWHLRCLWRPDQFDRVTNPGFESDTSGWAVSAGINTAGSSITRSTSNPYAGTACGRLVTQAAAESGAHFDLGSDIYRADAEHSTIYVLTMRLRRVSGSRRALISIGSEGDGAQRATLTIADLLDEWTEYAIAWRPSAEVSDAQVAVMTGDDAALTVDVDEVHVYSPQLSQVENGDFLSDVSGWITDGSLLSAAAASTLERVVGDYMTETACAELVTSSADGSGIDWPLGIRTFVAGRTYRLRLAARNLSGSTSLLLQLGSTGAADVASDTVTTTDDWAWYTLDWTPAADRTDVALSLSNGEAATQTVRIDAVEIYEALDEVAFQDLDIERGASVDGKSDPVGFVNGRLLDPDKTYSPRYAASPIAGAVRPGVRTFVRATFGGRARGIAYGVLRNVVPDPYAKAADFTGYDGLQVLKLAERIRRDFTGAKSYAMARDEVLTACGVGEHQRRITTRSIEASNFWDGTDGEEEPLGYLEELNKATGTIHYAEPSAVANIGWRYVTVGRAEYTNDDPGWVFSPDDLQGLGTAEVSEEALLNAIRVGWQSYDLLTPPGPIGEIDYPWGSVPAENGYRIVAIGADPAQHLGETPYVSYRRPQYGSARDPEPEIIYAVRRVKGKRRRRRLVRYDDPIFPISLAAGETRELPIDFSIPMEDIAVDVDATGVTVTTETEPARVVVRLAAGASGGTVSGLAVVAWPHFPQPEGEELVTDGSAAARRHEPEPVLSPYVPGPAMARGLGRHFVWRYADPRMRPTVVDRHEPTRQMSLQPASHATVTGERHDIEAMLCLVRSVHHTLRRGGRSFESSIRVEELPSTASSYITIGGGAAMGIGSSAVLAH